MSLFVYPDTQPPVTKFRGPPPDSSDPPSELDWLTRLAWGTCTWDDVPEDIGKKYQSTEPLNLYDVTCKACGKEGVSYDRRLRRSELFRPARGGGFVSSYSYGIKLTDSSAHPAAPSGGGMPS